MSAASVTSPSTAITGRFKTSARPGSTQRGTVFYGAWSQEGAALRVQQLSAAPWDVAQAEADGVQHDANELVILPPVAPSKIVALSPKGGFELIAPSALAPHRSMMTVAYVDHETRVHAALALVIGTRLRRLRATQQDAAVAALSGVAPAQSVEDSFWRSQDHGNGARARSFETYLPLGPLIHPWQTVFGSGAEIELRRNGESSQRVALSELLPDLAALLAEVTDCFTLLPGDVVLVRAEKDAPLTQPGDHLEVRLTGARTLTTNVGMRGSA